MPQSLRSILGSGNRIRKPAPRRQTSSPSPIKRNPSSSSATSPQSPSPRKQTSRPRPKKEAEDLFEERLEDIGTATFLSEELVLRDVIQAMRYIRNRMFSPVPERGIHSTRTTELLNYRKCFPAIVTAGHLHAVLGAPTRTEREVAELQQKGMIRRVRIDRRGGHGEAFIEMSDLESLIWSTTSLSPETSERFITWLRGNPMAQTVPQGVLSDPQADELIRTGFLTNPLHSNPGSTLLIRPEERTTLMSVDRVSRHASGSISAVGGANALHLAGGGSGGGGGGGGVGSSEGSNLKVALPGHGRYLKLADAGMSWLREALARTKWGECPESWLKERFEGGGLYGPRWKEFWGIEWEWVIGEAIGLGVVEIFETKSVGRGVRALGG